MKLQPTYSRNGKTHWSDVDTGGYTALDFALHDSHVLNANVFMRPLGHVGIYRVYSCTISIAARG